MTDREYSWSIASAVYQMKNGLSGERSDSAQAWLQDKIENGSAAEVTEIAELLFNAVAALIKKDPAKQLPPAVQERL